MSAGGVVGVVFSAEPKVLLDGLAMVESPRWHEGRFWFAHWAAGEIVAVDLDGRSEVRGAGPPRINAVRPDHGLGDDQRRVVRSDNHAVGELQVACDLAGSAVRPSFAGRLTAFDIEADGSLSNRRVWAEGLAPDAICLDADGAIWAGAADVRLATGRDDSPGGAVVRVREGGEILARIEHDRPIYGCALGGPDRRTLFLLAAEWRGRDKVAEVVAARTGQVLIVPAPAPGAGWP